MIEDERNNEDTGCRRMSKLLAFHNLQAKTMVVCVDALMASNGGQPVETAILMHILPLCLGDDFFSKKDEFQSEEILGWIDILSLHGILDTKINRHLVKFRKGFDRGLLIKESLKLVEKRICSQADHFSEWLSHICKQYVKCKENDGFKRAKQEALEKV